MTNDCKRCNQPLGHPASIENTYTQYCSKCKQCTKCRQYMPSADFFFNLKYAGDIKDFACTLCLAPELLMLIESKTVIIKERELELLNAAHLMIKPNLELSGETNAKEAELFGIKWFNELPSIEDKFLALRRIESLAATFSILLKKDPASKVIKGTLDKKQVDKYLAAESKLDAKYIPCSKCKQKFLEGSIDKHFKACTGPSTKVQGSPAPKERKVGRTEFEKLIDTLTRYGMTAGEAMREATKMFEAQGKIITITQEVS